MKIPIKKLKSGFEIPVYGLGTSRMGGHDERDVNNDDDADIAGIKAALDAGVTHIDTAEVYANGHSEILIGKAIKGYNRSNIFLVSKVQADNMAYENILNSCKKSLERLQTNYLDLYLLHRFSEKHSLRDSIRALDKLVDEGLIRNIGVCNFSKEHLIEAQSYTKNKIVYNQVHYNLEFREPEVTGLLEYCQNNDIILSAWSPLDKGNILRNIPDVLQEMCNKYAKTPVQIALNWLMVQPNVIILSKTRQTDHLNENLGAIGWQMDEEDVEKLRREYPNQKTVNQHIIL